MGINIRVFTGQQTRKTKPFEFSFRTVPVHKLTPKAQLTKVFLGVVPRLRFNVLSATFVPAPPITTQKLLFCGIDLHCLELAETRLSKKGSKRNC